MTDQAEQPEPLAVRHDLPAVPLRLADVPKGVSVRFGRLGWRRSPVGRPLVFVTIRCKHCRAEHWHHWRWDWGLDTDIVSLQQAPCFRGPYPRPPYWVGLDATASAYKCEVWVVWRDRRCLDILGSVIMLGSLPSYGTAAHTD